MHVIATAGHVDHGKSTLVRALTGMEPDRWAEEQRRGMTIDLGFGWTTLPDGAEIAFVDVPGHQKFVPNMLAGVGPAAAVLFVVAADEGWCRQSEEHLSALDALHVEHGLLAVTRSDLADPAPAMDQALKRIRATSLGEIEAVAVSGVTGAGVDDLREALRRMVRRLPSPNTSARVRLWVDRAFTIRGSGTVVTGTLGEGSLRVGDTLEISPAGLPVRVRGLESLKRRADSVDSVARVAVNLRGIDVAAVGRGDALVTVGSWRATDLIDVRVAHDEGPLALPKALVMHVGSAAVAVAVRRLGDDTARLRLATALPLQPGDRALLRDPGEQQVLAGVTVLDAAPEALIRRGAAARRAAALEDMSGAPDPAGEVRRRGAVRRVELAAWGVLAAGAPAPAGTVAVGDWLVSTDQWAQWHASLLRAVIQEERVQALRGGLTVEAARRAVGVPAATLLQALVGSSSVLEADRGLVRRAGAAPGFSALQRTALDQVTTRLAESPYDAPSRADLEALGLTAPVLAAAVRNGILLALTDGIYLLPDITSVALPALADLAQPFSMSEARQALGTSRRVAVPLLEHLDRLGLTRR
ncbi:MAG TPA: selenocysteine-specific translation elongation factor, partial [Mycobacteriales bacterium]|nr:selenocysteine-specific translation elongation factor [Mycobacteriales bacterium]